ncbi:MAG: hypothetical protein WAM14_12955 [Candidatus Nitrosopolaris sp.]
MPLFLVADPVASTGLTSIVTAACLVLDEGSFIAFERDTPPLQWKTTFSPFRNRFLH